MYVLYGGGVLYIIIGIIVCARTSIVLNVHGSMENVLPCEDSARTRGFPLRYKDVEDMSKNRGNDQVAIDYKPSAWLEEKEEEKERGLKGIETVCPRVCKIRL